MSTEAHKIESSLPHQGEVSYAPQKKFQETFIFVHHFDGSKKTLRRHIETINKLGFDAVAFNLTTEALLKTYRIPLDAKMKFGYKHLWADEVSDILNLVSGPKIIHSFSGPSMGAIEAISRRFASDISGLICEGGPFTPLWKPLWRYYQQERKISIPWRAVRTAVDSFSASLHYSEDLAQNLKSFPDQFPILSIRGWKDPLVPQAYIDRVFEPHAHLRWMKLSLPEAHHIDGLKVSPEEYLRGLEGFVTQVCESI